MNLSQYFINKHNIDFVVLYIDRGLQKASNDEQLLLIHDTEKILGHHDRYFPGGKPLELIPSALLPQLDSDEVILHDIVRSRNLEDLIRFLEVLGNFYMVQPGIRNSNRYFLLL